MKEVELFSDGACSGNPGPGGWGAVLRFKGIEKELSGGEPDTTNNRMELTAVISALSMLKEPCDVVLTSDSKYVTDAINAGWLQKWSSNGWRKGNKKPVENIDLWEQLVPLLCVHGVRFGWVKGHNGHPENEECDRIASQLAK